MTWHRNTGCLVAQDLALPAKVRTLIHEEISLLTVRYLPFPVRTPYNWSSQAANIGRATRARSGPNRAASRRDRFGAPPVRGHDQSASVQFPCVPPPSGIVGQVFGSRWKRPDLGNQACPRDVTPPEECQTHRHANAVTGTDSRPARTDACPWSVSVRRE